MAKKEEAKKAAPRALAPIVTKQLELTPTQKAYLAQSTPPDFIRTKPGRGGKKISYVEGGYVISRLNQVFGPLNWSYEEKSREKSDRKTEKSAEGEVTVHGRLTVHDHIKGYAVWKEADGQHPIHANVPLGDAYKAANTDALKKAASLFGIAIDVYWQMFEQEGSVSVEPRGANPPVPNKKDLFEAVKRSIKGITDLNMLGQMQIKVMSSKIYTEPQKKELLAIIHEKLGE